MKVGKEVNISCLLTFFFKGEHGHLVKHGLYFYVSVLIRRFLMGNVSWTLVDNL